MINASFGKAALTEILKRARPSMKDAKEREELYDFARLNMMHLVRSDRSADDLEPWKEGMRRIAALATATSPVPTPVEVEEALDPHLLLAVRFHVLADLLADQEMWKTYYSFEEVLKFPHIRETLLYFLGKGNVGVKDYFDALGIKHAGCLTILSNLRLLTWSEEEGVDQVWLTLAGQQKARELLAKDGPIV